ncbi:PspA/IM30 family protein [Metabacillus fastidiosus]|uniref:PspA/IM30 family protein n=1 Tax=Metabacillus fastidiosus TaxID=1458 RepID=A0ABU6P2G2_9BACI|nr:PspA/IM30 family protein [Metabacillus fastidiosus]MED4403471.1 PspA/IM30 family protein [Metabacillus fastidiosus]MED4454067.1 PspA/IM30 family protein [Metabacillus fastidiosus]MED4460825.1 PspA/IM30 family protein [Metabacillus fastidiosus]
MANLFTRIRDSISQDLHEVLDKKEQKNPLSVLNHYLRQCEQEAEKVRKLVERQYLLKEEFTREYREAEQLAEKRKYQAEVASKAGESDLYEFALKEQVHYEERLERIRNSRNEAERHLTELEQKYEEMKHKLKDMHIKRMELMGRENIARANHRINKVLESGNYDSKPFSKFDEMEDYLDRLENKVNSEYYRNTIDSRIAQLEKQANVSENSL